jgi:hypothetical protein
MLFHKGASLQDLPGLPVQESLVWKKGVHRFYAIDNL